MLLHQNLLSLPSVSYRDPTDSLALSSRNAYLSPAERAHGAPMLIAALRAAKFAWEAGRTKSECIDTAREVVEAAGGIVHRRLRSGAEDLENVGDGTEGAFGAISTGAVQLDLDYVEMNDPDTFEVLESGITRAMWEGETEGETAEARVAETGRPVILSGALWVGRTRLIDNIVLGDQRRLGILKA